MQCGGIHQGEERNLDCSELSGTETPFDSESFWARCYFVSTVGLDEEVVRQHIGARNKRSSVWSSC